MGRRLSYDDVTSSQPIAASLSAARCLLTNILTEVYTSVNILIQLFSTIKYLCSFNELLAGSIWLCCILRHFLFFISYRSYTCSYQAYNLIFRQIKRPKKKKKKESLTLIIYHILFEI